MIDRLFAADIGFTIKRAAKGIFVFFSLLYIIGGFAGIVYAISEYEEYLILPCIAIIVLGPVISLILMLFLYAFGELVDKTVDTANNTKESLDILQKMWRVQQEKEMLPKKSDVNESKPKTNAPEKVIVNENGDNGEEKMDFTVLADGTWLCPVCKRKNTSDKCWNCGTVKD